MSISWASKHDYYFLNAIYELNITILVLRCDFILKHNRVINEMLDIDVTFAQACLTRNKFIVLF